jgi:hypothetical protein
MKQFVYSLLMLLALQGGALADSHEGEVKGEKPCNPSNHK